MIRPSRMKVPAICEICGKECSVRRDFLKRKNYHYQCKSCAMKSIKRDFSIERRLELSKIHRKFPLNENYFEDLDSENKAYWLGFIAGDGNICGHKFSIHLSKKDKNHLILLKNELGWEGKLLKREECNTFGFSISSLKMSMDLANFGVIPNKTFLLRFPFLEKHLVRHFIRGYFDADGCIYKSIKNSSGKHNNYIRYSGGFEIVGNRDFLFVMQKEFLKMGLPKTSLNHHNPKIARLRYGGIKSLRTIYNYLYNDSNICMGRKQKLFKEIIDNYHSEIEYIEK